MKTKRQMQGRRKERTEGKTKEERRREKMKQIIQHHCHNHSHIFVTYFVDSRFSLLSVRPVLHFSYPSSQNRLMTPNPRKNE